MIKMRTLGIGALGLVLSTHSLHSQDRSRYRDFHLGGDLPSISALTGVAASEAKKIHSRPLQWRRPYSVSSTTPSQTDQCNRLSSASTTISSRRWWSITIAIGQPA